MILNRQQYEELAKSNIKESLKRIPETLVIALIEGLLYTGVLQGVIFENETVSQTAVRLVSEVKQEGV
jgi:hypothetical protein